MYKLFSPNDSLSFTIRSDPVTSTFPHKHQSSTFNSTQTQIFFSTRTQQTTFLHPPPAPPRSVVHNKTKQQPSLQHALEQEPHHTFSTLSPSRVVITPSQQRQLPHISLNHPRGCAGTTLFHGTAAQGKVLVQRTLPRDRFGSRSLHRNGRLLCVGMRRGLVLRRALCSSSRGGLCGLGLRDPRGCGLVRGIRRGGGFVGRRGICGLRRRVRGGRGCGGSVSLRIGILGWSRGGLRSVCGFRGLSGGGLGLEGGGLLMRRRLLVLKLFGVLLVMGGHCWMEKRQEKVQECTYSWIQKL
ncbi:hypothetical protein BCR33DRAFT_498941 [Rhizoclosmatium globosum]|uniref:Uncharacterized protein n=1 Tax=Rhizoclosmatium globosum TaxID=329046 RepID=A0A1Y2CVA5_9FUNG|nr:hypothetical protein BCR33DRAFT_498941 [Rhizoclosmatium globosum]|eukprot:ORY50952.1 hypothetical protein BCR33DRAFT_498941 [Rhizoclosmatium globosum]